MMSAQEFLKNIRYKLCLTQSQFGELVGMGKATISLYETGDRKPRMGNIKKIVDTLKKNGIEIEYSDLQDKK